MPVQRRREPRGPPRSTSWAPPDRQDAEPLSRRALRSPLTSQGRRSRSRSSLRPTARPPRRVVKPRRRPRVRRASERTGRLRRLRSSCRLPTAFDLAGSTRRRTGRPQPGGRKPNGPGEAVFGEMPGRLPPRPRAPRRLAAAGRLDALVVSRPADKPDARDSLPPDRTLSGSRRRKRRVSAGREGRAAPPPFRSTAAAMPLRAGRRPSLGGSPHADRPRRRSPPGRSRTGRFPAGDKGSAAARKAESQATHGKRRSRSSGRPSPAWVERSGVERSRV